MSLTQQGLVAFAVQKAGKPCQTWYTSFGDLSHRNSKTSLIILHGGSGACHEYLLSMRSLTEKYGIPTIHYDQIGNGKSTRLPEKNGDEAFWDVQLFVDELTNLIEHLGLREFDLLGQSWGGMLAAECAIRQIEGLRRVIISSGAASLKDWATAVCVLYDRLPEKEREILRRCEKDGTTDSPEYEKAMEAFYSRFFCQVPPPPEVLAGFEHMKEDNTTYGTMWGVSESHITGSLRSWDIKDQLDKIEVPVLLLNGIDDEAQDSVVRPLYHGIKKVKWFTFDNASHLQHVEHPEKYTEVVADFLLY